MDNLASQLQNYLHSVSQTMEAFETTHPQGSALQLTSAGLAESIYQKMTNYRFCKKRPVNPQTNAQIIHTCIQQGQPIPIVICHGPRKNPRNCWQQTPDWAEFFTYLQLMRLAIEVKKFYKPGIQVTLYLDDARAAFANDYDWEQMNTYQAQLRAFVQATPFRHVVTDIQNFKTLYETYHHADYLEEAKGAVEAWKQDPISQEILVKLYQQAARNLTFPLAMSLEQQDAMCKEAVDKYLVAYEAEKLCGLWDLTNQIDARYNPPPVFDEQEGYYQLFTFRKGSITQPWQGQGCLLWLNQKTLDPFLETQTKSADYHCIETVATEFAWPTLSHLKVYQAQITTPVSQEMSQHPQLLTV